MFGEIAHTMSVRGLFIIDLRLELRGQQTSSLGAKSGPLSSKTENLRMVFTFFSGWRKGQKKNNILCYVRII